MGEDTERTEGGDQARPFTLPVEGVIETGVFATEREFAEAERVNAS